MRTKVRAVLLCVVASVCLSSCSDEELRQQVGRFNTTVQEASGAVKGFYLGVNDFRRKSYLTGVRLKSGSDLLIEREVNGEKKSTGLLRYYSDEYIQARVIAFKALASYTEGLALMASSDAPSKAERAIVVTGDDVGKLGNQLQALGNSPGKSVDVAKFSTPIAKLASIATREFLEHLKDKNVSDSLDKSREAVDELCKALKDDINETSKLVEDAESAKLLALYRSYYNRTPDLKGGRYSDSARTNYLNDVEKAAKTAADISSSNPALLVEDIQKGHDQIMDYLDQKKKHGREELEGYLTKDLHQFEQDARTVKELVGRLNFDSTK